MTIIRREKVRAAKATKVHSGSLAMITQVVNLPSLTSIEVSRSSDWGRWIQTPPERSPKIDSEASSSSAYAGYRGFESDRIGCILNKRNDSYVESWRSLATEISMHDVHTVESVAQVAASRLALDRIRFLEEARKFLVQGFASRETEDCQAEFAIARDVTLIVSRARAVPSRFRWPSSAAEALACLENNRIKTTDRDKAVLASTLYEYRGKLRERFLNGLERYIDDFRFTQDEDRIVVVGGAIRSYALYMDEPEFERYAEWLVDEPGQAISDDLTLELVKGVCWRIQFEPLETRGIFPFLSKVVSLVASKYVDHRFLSRGKCGAIGVNAVPALFLLGAVSEQEELASDAWSIALNSQTSWFIEDVLSRLKSAAGYVGEHSQDLAKRLNEMIARICDEEAYRTCQHGG